MSTGSRLVRASVGAWTSEEELQRLADHFFRGRDAAFLEDLAVIGLDESIGNSGAPDDPTTAIQPLIPPSFTGSLELDLWAQMDSMTSQLLSTPGGLHFRRLHLTLNKQTDASAIAALVGRCHVTLESLEVVCELFCTFICC